MPAPVSLPADVSVLISKRGDQPAKITVERGQQKWEVSEKELDKLPADVRPFADQLLGRTAMAGPAAAPGALRLPSAIEPWANRQTGAAGERRLEDRLDEIERRLDKLVEAVDGLRAGSPTKK